MMRQSILPPPIRALHSTPAFHKGLVLRVERQSHLLDLETSRLRRNGQEPRLELCT